MDNSTCSSIQSKETAVNTSCEVETPYATSQEINNSIIKSISENLRELIEQNEQYYKNRKARSRSDIFCLNKLPLISISDFMKKLMAYSNADISALILTILHIDNFCDINHYKIYYQNVHLLLLATFILTTKYNEDIYINERKYAEILGISPEYLGNLEFEVFSKLKYSLYVESDYYQKYYDYFIGNSKSE